MTAGLGAAVRGRPAAFGSADAIKQILRSLAFLPVNPRVPLYFDATLPLGWTLLFEAYFYLVFAVSMLFAALALGGPVRLAHLFGDRVPDARGAA